MHEGPGAQGSTISSEVSITLTVPSPWFTTNTNSPSELITAQTGCEPTGMVLITVSSTVEISVTLLLPWFTTKILLFAPLPAIITGSVPTAIDAVTAKTPAAIK